MSSYRRHLDWSVLVDASDNVVGVLGVDGRQWSFPDGAAAGVDTNLVVGHAAMLYDPATNTPQGFFVGGVEYLFADAFTLNTNPAVKVRQRGLLMSASGQPMGIKGEKINGMFPNPPTAGGGVVTPDTDVTAYAAAVTAAGGSLPAAQQLALNTYIPALKASGAWALIKEMWLPLGNASDLTTAAVKLKNGATSPTVTLTNFVAGDYTIATGIDAGAGNSSKKVVTDFVPSTSATNGLLTAAEWGFSAYVTRQNTSGTGCSMGTVSNASAYLQVVGNGSFVGGKLVNLQNSLPSQSFQGRRLATTQQTGGVAYGYMGGYVQGSAANAAPAALPSVSMSVFSTNNAFWSNGASSGYIIHAPMTAAQLRALQTFYDNVCQTIGRTIFADMLVAVGDSYVAPAPTGPSDVAHDWVALVATARGYGGYSLRGTSGIGWANGASTMLPFNGVNIIFTSILNQPATRVIIPLGINDANSAGSASAVTASASPLLTMLIQSGYPLQYLALATMYPWTGLPDQVLAAAIAQAERDLATANSMHLIDFFTGSTAGVTGYEVGIHKNDAGHAALASDVIAVITGGAWAGW